MARGIDLGGILDMFGGGKDRSRPKRERFSGPIRAPVRKPIEHQIVNEYRGAISALNSGAPFMFTKSDSALGGSLLHFARAVDKPAAAEATAALSRGR